MHIFDHLIAYPVSARLTLFHGEVTLMDDFHLLQDSLLGANIRLNLEVHCAHLEIIRFIGNSITVQHVIQCYLYLVESLT